MQVYYCLCKRETWMTQASYVRIIQATEVDLNDRKKMEEAYQNVLPTIMSHPGFYIELFQKPEIDVKELLVKDDEKGWK